MTGQHFVKENKYVTHGSQSIIPAETRSRGEVIQEGSVETFLSNGVDPDIQEVHKAFEDVFLEESTANLIEDNRDRTK